MAAKRMNRSERKEPIGVSMSPFLAYVSEMKGMRFGGRSQFICNLIQDVADAEGFSPNDPEYIKWMTQNGYVHIVDAPQKPRMDPENLGVEDPFVGPGS